MSEYRCPICLSYQNTGSEFYTHGKGCPQLKHKDEMPKIKTTKECIAEAIDANNKWWIKKEQRLIAACDEYIKLLEQENSSLTGIAYVHGWKSNSYQKGIDCRTKIEQIKKEATDER